MKKLLVHVWKSGCFSPKERIFLAGSFHAPLFHLGKELDFLRDVLQYGFTSETLQVRLIKTYPFQPGDFEGFTHGRFYDKTVLQNAICDRASHDLSAGLPWTRNPPDLQALMCFALHVGHARLFSLLLDLPKLNQADFLQHDRFFTALLACKVPSMIRRVMSDRRPLLRLLIAQTLKPTENQRAQQLANWLVLKSDLLLSELFPLISLLSDGFLAQLYRVLKEVALGWSRILLLSKPLKWSPATVWFLIFKTAHYQDWDKTTLKDAVRQIPLTEKVVIELLSLLDEYPSDSFWSSTNEQPVRTKTSSCRELLLERIFNGNLLRPDKPHYRFVLPSLLFHFGRDQIFSMPQLAFPPQDATLIEGLGLWAFSGRFSGMSVFFRKAFQEAAKTPGTTLLLLNPCRKKPVHVQFLRQMQLEWSQRDLDTLPKATRSLARFVVSNLIADDEQRLLHPFVARVLFHSIVKRKTVEFVDPVFWGSILDPEAIDRFAFAREICFYSKNRALRCLEEIGPIEIAVALLAQGPYVQHNLSLLANALWSIRAEFERLRQFEPLLTDPRIKRQLGNGFRLYLYRRYYYGLPPKNALWNDPGTEFAYDRSWLIPQTSVSRIGFEKPVAPDLTLFYPRHAE